VLCVPALRKSLRVRVVPDEGICLFYGADAKVLSDPRLCSVLELVDGRRTASDLAQLLSDRLSTAEVFHVLMHLEGRDTSSKAGNVTTIRLSMSSQRRVTIYGTSHMS
jgi:hypothetical protein